MVGEVLNVLLRLLSTIDYDYSVVDSTKFTDWLKSLHELFIDVRVFDAWALVRGLLYCKPSSGCLRRISRPS
jgi:hypothetical protein